MLFNASLNYQRFLTSLREPHDIKIENPEHESDSENNVQLHDDIKQQQLWIQEDNRQELIKQAKRF